MLAEEPPSPSCQDCIVIFCKKVFPQAMDAQLYTGSCSRLSRRLFRWLCSCLATAVAPDMHTIQPLITLSLSVNLPRTSFHEATACECHKTTRNSHLLLAVAQSCTALTTCIISYIPRTYHGCSLRYHIGIAPVPQKFRVASFLPKCCLLFSLETPCCEVTWSYQ